MQRYTLLYGLRTWATRKQYIEAVPLQLYRRLHDTSLLYSSRLYTYALKTSRTRGSAGLTATPQPMLIKVCHIDKMLVHETSGSYNDTTERESSAGRYSVQRPWARELSKKDTH